jgi:hypothetical protein
MGWIVQEYEGEVHVVPDTEPGHVLESNCFCAPEIEIHMRGLEIIHRDELQRTVKEFA